VVFIFLNLVKGSRILKKERPLWFKEVDDKTVSINLMPKAKIVSSSTQRFDGDIIALHDWDEIYHSVPRFKKDKEWSNRLITKQELYDVIAGAIYTFSDSAVIRSIGFDGHLYRPCLVLTPGGLNKGEAEFMEDLRAYLDTSLDRFVK
jgi:hypothetical protein